MLFIKYYIHYQSNLNKITKIHLQVLKLKITLTLCTVVKQVSAQLAEIRSAERVKGLISDLHEVETNEV